MAFRYKSSKRNYKKATPSLELKGIGSHLYEPLGILIRIRIRTSRKTEEVFVSWFSGGRGDEVKGNVHGEWDAGSLFFVKRTSEESFLELLSGNRGG